MDISGKLDNTATGLNSNIGCFEMYKDDIFGEDNKTLNSNIGCFEIYPLSENRKFSIS